MEVNDSIFRFGEKMFENNSLDEPKMTLSLQGNGQKRNLIMIKIEFTPLLDCNILPFFQ